jgi:hypothetical protein
MSLPPLARDALIVLLAVNVATTLRVLLAAGYTPKQKAWQVLIIWLLPVLGAVVCWFFVSSDRAPPGPVRSGDAPPDRTHQGLSQVAWGHRDGEVPR